MDKQSSQTNWHDVSVTYKVPYSFGRTDFIIPALQDLSEWIRENTHHAWKQTSSLIIGDVIYLTISFEDKIDAGFFALRWR